MASSGQQALSKDRSPSTEYQASKQKSECVKQGAITKAGHSEDGRAAEVIEDALNFGGQKISGAFGEIWPSQTSRFYRWTSKVLS